MPNFRPKAIVMLALCALAAAVHSALAAAPELAPLTGADQPGSAWKPLGLPRQTKPWTRFVVVTLDGQRVLRVEAENSYGNLVHAVPSQANESWHLSWRWRVDEPNTRSDLRHRAGDDSPIKVCVMFDLPMTAVPFIEQQLLGLMQARSSDPLPTATVCYVWDSQLAAGSVLDNAFTRRLRVIVLRGGDAPLRSWLAERRDVAADFMRLFGDESRTVPPVLAIGIGGDADNTHLRSVAHVADVRLR